MEICKKRFEIYGLSAIFICGNIEELDKLIENNNPYTMSTQFIKDMYNKNTDKLAFDEMTKIIVQGGHV